jgi:hypothetical protein
MWIAQSEEKARHYLWIIDNERVVVFHWFDRMFWVTWLAKSTNEILTMYKFYGKGRTLLYQLFLTRHLIYKTYFIHILVWNPTKYISFLGHWLDNIHCIWNITWCTLFSTQINTKHMLLQNGPCHNLSTSRFDKNVFQILLNIDCKPPP